MINLIKKLKAHNLVVKTGCFGSDMCIKLENDGPCTPLLLIQGVSMIINGKEISKNIINKLKKRLS